MIAWAEFCEREPSLARAARERLEGRVAYLATVRADGGPRVHPVSPRWHDGRLFVRMYPSSPKVNDLRRDPRFSLHSEVEDTSGMGGEFLITGRAALVSDRSWIDEAFEGLPDPNADRYVVFEFRLSDVISTAYE